MLSQRVKNYVEEIFERTYSMCYNVRIQDINIRHSDTDLEGSACLEFYQESEAQELGLSAEWEGTGHGEATEEQIRRRGECREARPSHT